MLIRLLALTLLSEPVLTGLAYGQAAQAQAPIVCPGKDSAGNDACLQKLKSLFKIKGDALTVPLDGGKSKTYVSTPAACDGETTDVQKCRAFSMLGYFPQTRSYLIVQALYECGVLLFVSRKTGSETVMQAVPALSPNAKYLISIDQSEACERDHDIAIWSMQADPPKLEFGYKATQYENWEVVAWKDDTHLKMKAWVNGNGSYDQEAELIRQGSSWSLVLGKKTERP
jgi:hypothetical protein